MKPRSKPDNQAHSPKAVVERMQADGLPELVIDTFCHHYTKLVDGDQLLLPEDAIEPVQSLPDSQMLTDLEEVGLTSLSRTAVFKLNGGLGTSMGLDKAKSLLPAKDGLTFLDIIVRQIHALRTSTGWRIPLILMNSFSTEDDSRAKLDEYPEFISAQGDVPLSFKQHRIPKIRQDNFRPVEHSADSELEWCPPGHGDFYTALVTSGILQTLLDQGFEYAFVSNADNLGASPDPTILGFFAESEAPFMMEVTDRTAADKKGGHLAKTHTGQLLLRERAQCPADELRDFENINKYRYFNTNNLWINLRSLQAHLEKCDYILDLPLITNQKTVDPRDPQSTPIYQLETAMGAAISVLPGAQAIRVPRSRFCPVKTTNDLLALWSDIYALTDDMRLVQNPARTTGTIVIELDPEYYAMIHDFQHRFKFGAPSLVHCSELRIKGDFEFDGDVEINGILRVRNSTHHEIAVPAGARIKSYMTGR